jgi:hypothetical protein
MEGDSEHVRLREAREEKVPFDADPLVHEILVQVPPCSFSGYVEWMRRTGIKPFFRRTL